MGGFRCRVMHPAPRAGLAAAATHHPRDHATPTRLRLTTRTAHCVCILRPPRALGLHPVSRKGEARAPPTPRPASGILHPASSVCVPWFTGGGRLRRRRSRGASAPGRSKARGEEDGRMRKAQLSTCGDRCGGWVGGARCAVLGAGDTGAGAGVSVGGIELRGVEVRVSVGCGGAETRRRRPAFSPCVGVGVGVACAPAPTPVLHPIPSYLETRPAPRVRRPRRFEGEEKRRTPGPIPCIGVCEEARQRRGKAGASSSASPPRIRSRATMPSAPAHPIPCSSALPRALAPRVSTHLYPSSATSLSTHPRPLRVTSGTTPTPTPGNPNAKPNAYASSPSCRLWCVPKRHISLVSSLCLPLYALVGSYTPRCADRRGSGAILLVRVGGCGAWAWRGSSRSKCKPLFARAMSSETGDSCILNNFIYGGTGGNGGPGMEGSGGNGGNGEGPALSYRMDTVGNLTMNNLCVENFPLLYLFHQSFSFNFWY
ncbi:hypothetical protein B0H11DRAFT_2287408 [Mycena galericulata]|nr:hypothetical protein B0H11DRAFT_2287408 [Mycena galericulata]